MMDTEASDFPGGAYDAETADGKQQLLISQSLRPGIIHIHVSGCMCMVLETNDGEQ